MARKRSIIKSAAIASLLEPEEEGISKETVKKASTDLFAQIRTWPPAHQVIVRDKWLTKAAHYEEEAATARENAQFRRASQFDVMAELYRVTASKIKPNA